jgi:hypothetical protein
VYFDINQNGYFFDSNPAKTGMPPEGTLLIECSPHIPDMNVSIGIGIKGAAALAVQARPNLKFTFIPHLRYWITFGNFIQGGTMGKQSMTIMVTTPGGSSVFFAV